MQRRRAFTLVHLVIVIVILVLAAAVLLPVLTAARRPARAMQSSTPLRGIHAGLVLYSQGNNSYYPGLAADGSIDSAVGLTTQGRVSILIEQNYFSLEYARSPLETQTNTTSYALLQVNVEQDGVTVPQGGRNAEWKNTTNGQSVVISDRAVPVNGSFTTIKSIHSATSGSKSGWTGQVAWNDNHVTFEQTSHLPTRYAKKSHLIDALFASPGDAHSGDDAFMVWSGTNSL